MANHIRRQVREAFVTLLTGLATTGSRVTVNNDDPLDLNVSSALRINVGPESIEQRATNGDHIETQRAMTFVVRALARGTTSVAVLNTLDDICQEVEEAALPGDAKYLGGLVRGMQIVGTDTVVTGEAAEWTGHVDMQFELLTSVREGAPDTLA